MKTRGERERGGSIKEIQKEKHKKRKSERGERGQELWINVHFLSQQSRRDSGVYRLQIRSHLNHPGSYFPLPCPLLSSLLCHLWLRWETFPVREIKRETEGLRKTAQSGSTDQSREHKLSAARGWIWFTTFITSSSAAIWLWLVLLRRKIKKEFSRGVKTSLRLWRFEVDTYR